MKRIGLLALAAIALGSALPAIAHHNFIAVFNINDRFEVTGKVASVRFINPHSSFKVEVQERGKPVLYEFELDSAVHMSRKGWKRDTLKPGDVITVYASRARARRTEGFVFWVRFADGRKLEVKQPPAT